MNIKFTTHAEFRIKKRGLLKEEITRALNFPDKILKKHGKYYYQKKLDRGTIEIVAEITESNINVITLYWL
jgi:hypothetical protein